MKTPDINDKALFDLIKSAKAEIQEVETQLAPEDEQYLKGLIASVRAGKPAVLIVEDTDGRLKYMFSNATRVEAIMILGKVVEATGRKLTDE